MKIKTFVENNEEELDKKVNEFNEKHNVKFTQTGIAMAGNSMISVRLMATLFYED